jgi:GWxTD domain-containing protein
MVVMKKTVAVRSTGLNHAATIERKAERKHWTKTAGWAVIRHAVFVLTGVTLSTFSPCHLYGDEFKGELKLVGRLDPEEQFTYFGLRYLMNRHQQRHFLSLPSKEARKRWIEFFWADVDPTPTTEVNERRIEHEKRVYLARKLFRMKKAPGWDKRGETLIRFGLPSSRTRTWGNIGFYRMTPPGEVWYYTSLDLLVTFEDFNLKGEYIYAIEPYGRTARQDLERIKNIYDLSKYGFLQQLYATEYIDLEDLKDLADFNPDQIDYEADPDIRLDRPKDLIAAIEREKLEKSANNFYKYMKEKPTIYSFEINQEPLPVYFDVTAFDGGGGLLRTEINFEIPSSEIRFIPIAGTLSAEVQLRVLVRNTLMETVASGGDVVRATQSGGESFSGPSSIPGQVVLSLEPGYYRLGLEAFDTGSGKRGAFKTNLRLDALGEGLSLSDIQFASSITETEQNRKFVKGNLQVVPHPLHAYRIPFPLRFYFEIYGLGMDRDGLAFYAIDYSIVPLEKRRRGPILEEIPAAISSRFETTGFGSKQVQRLEIATDNLWKGKFELTVRVTDRRTLASTQKSSHFTLLE